MKYIAGKEATSFNCTFSNNSMCGYKYLASTAILRLDINYTKSDVSGASSDNSEYRINGVGHLTVGIVAMVF